MQYYYLILTSIFGVFLTYYTYKKSIGESIYRAKKKKPIYESIHK